MKKSEYLHCGQIINTHGVRGTLKCRPDCDSPEILASLPCVFTASGDEYKQYDIISSSIQKSFVLLTLSGVDDIDAAIALKGSEIFARREELMKFMADGDRFIADLIGLPIIHADSGETLGVLRDVFNAGASDIYVIDTERGERMMPAVAEYVTEINDDAISVRPIPGMLD